MAGYLIADQEVTDQALFDEFAKGMLEFVSGQQRQVSGAGRELPKSLRAIESPTA